MSHHFVCLLLFFVPYENEPTIASSFSIEALTLLLVAWAPKFPGFPSHTSDLPPANSVDVGSSLYFTCGRANEQMVCPVFFGDPLYWEARERAGEHHREKDTRRERVGH